MCCTLRRRVAQGVVEKGEALSDASPAPSKTSLRSPKISSIPGHRLPKALPMDGRDADLAKMRSLQPASCLPVRESARRGATEKHLPNNEVEAVVCLANETVTLLHHNHEHVHLLGRF